MKLLEIPSECLSSNAYLFINACDLTSASMCLSTYLFPRLSIYPSVYLPPRLFAYVPLYTLLVK